MTSGDIYMLNRIFSTTGTLSGQLYFSLVSFFSSLFFSLSFSSLFFSLSFSSLFFSLSFSSFHFLLFCFFWLLNFFWLGTAFPKYTEFPGLIVKCCHVMNIRTSCLPISVATSGCVVVFSCHLLSVSPNSSCPHCIKCRHAINIRTSCLPISVRHR